MLSTKGSVRLQKSQHRQQTPTKAKHTALGSPQPGPPTGKYSFQQSMLNQHMRMRRLMNQSVDFKVNSKQYNLGKHAMGLGNNADLVDRSQGQATAEKRRAVPPLAMSQGTTKLQSDEEHKASIGTF